MTTSVRLTMAGDVGIMGQAKFGFEWDPVEQRAVAWDDGPDLYVLEAPAGDWKTGTWTWIRVPPAPANTVVPARGFNGTYSRFRYVPSVNAFVVVSSTDGPVWMVRMNSDIGPGPNPEAGVRGTWAAVFSLAALVGLGRRKRAARAFRPCSWLPPHRVEDDPQQLTEAPDAPDFTLDLERGRGKTAPQRQRARVPGGLPVTS